MRARRRKRRVRIVLILILLVALLCSAIVGLTWLPSMRIEAVEVSGVESVPASMIQASVQKALLGTYWYLFPKNNIFLYPRTNIEQQIRSQFSALMRVEVRARDFRTIDILVAERAPQALWCGIARRTMAEGDSNTSPAPCLLLDQDGFAYASAADFFGNAYVHYFGALASSSTPPEFLSVEKFHALSALVDDLVKKIGTVSSVTIENVQDARVSFANGFDLLFTLQDNGAGILERYALALTTDPFSKHPLEDFQYLDLRFGDKLYYKLK